jgi:hypothetical protein
MDHGGCRISTVVDRHALQLIYYSTIKKTVSRLRKRVHRRHNVRATAFVKRFPSHRARINAINSARRVQKQHVAKSTTNIDVFCTLHNVGVKSLPPTKLHTPRRVFLTKACLSQQSAL